jgi:RNAse (barnase) inhibitor barstar
MDTKLAQILENNGYTLYTPFRTTDYPGVLFILTKNHQGRVTEFTVAKVDETFTVPREQLFDEKGDSVDWFSELKDTFDFSADAGLQLTGLFDLKAGGNYVSSLDIQFKDPKLRHLISFKRLSELAPNLSTGVKNVLHDFKQKGQLDNVFLVLETVRVAGMKTTIHLKQGLSAEAGLKKLKEIANVNADLKIATGDSITLSSDNPLIIGYKAMIVPETFLATQISAADLSDAKAFPVQELNTLKK